LKKGQFKNEHCWNTWVAFYQKKHGVVTVRQNSLVYYSHQQALAFKNLENNLQYLKNYSD